MIVNIKLLKLFEDTIVKQMAKQRLSFFSGFGPEIHLDNTKSYQYLWCRVDTLLFAMSLEKEPLSSFMTLLTAKDQCPEHLIPGSFTCVNEDPRIEMITLQLKPKEPIHSTVYIPNAEGLFLKGDFTLNYVLNHNDRVMIKQKLNDGWSLAFYSPSDHYEYHIDWSYPRGIWIRIERKNGITPSKNFLPNDCMGYVGNETFDPNDFVGQVLEYTGKTRIGLFNGGLYWIKGYNEADRTIRTGNDRLASLGDWKIPRLAK